MSESGYTYGNISTPKHPGFLGVGAAASGAAFAGAMLGLASMFLGQLWISIAFFILGVLAAVILSMAKRRGRSRVERAVAGHMFKKAVKQGSTTYVSGPASSLPDGSFRAPGLLAGTRMMESHDHFGRRFALLWDPRELTGTIFFGAEGIGAGLLDQSSIDSLVDGWASYLRDTGSSVDLLQVAVTTQTTRDQGQRLPSAVEANRNASRLGEVPEFASSTVDEIVTEINNGVPRIEQRIMATFSAAELKEEGTKPRTADELATDISAFLPSIVEQLALSGAGTVTLLVPEDIIDQVHVAYNPDTALAVELARLSGQGTGLRWEEVGPAYANAQRDRYIHGSGVSRTFQVWRPPSGVFRENSLTAILSPDRVSEQKRVTILYRPMSPETSSHRVQTAVRNAEFEVNQKGKRPTQEQLLALQKARVAEREQAEGAAVMRFAIMITVTVDDEEKLARAGAAVKRACSTGVQLQIRASDGNEDAAFGIALGMGIVPARHATLSMSLREAL